MSRGAQQTTRNLTDQQLAQQNQMISQENQSDTQDRSNCCPPRRLPARFPGDCCR
jgi:hypothetical protein